MGSSEFFSPSICLIACSGRQMVLSNPSLAGRSPTKVYPSGSYSWLLNHISEFSPRKKLWTGNKTTWNTAIWIDSVLPVSANPNGNVALVVPITFLKGGQKNKKQGEEYFLSYSFSRPPSGHELGLDCLGTIQSSQTGIQWQQMH